MSCFGFQRPKVPVPEKKNTLLRYPWVSTGKGRNLAQSQSAQTHLPWCSPTTISFVILLLKLLCITSNLAVTSLSWVTDHQNAVYNHDYRQGDISVAEFYPVMWHNREWFKGLWSNSWCDAFPQNAIKNEVGGNKQKSTASASKKQSQRTSICPEGFSDQNQCFTK